MVHYDIDAICSCRILQSLLRFKHVPYTICIVRGVEDLKIAFQENANDVKYFVLINCGGTLDIVELLEPEEEIVFFVLDSHRPTDLCNIYSESQIRLLWRHEDDGDVPGFEDVFSDDESGGSGEESDEVIVFCFMCVCVVGLIVWFVGRTSGETATFGGGGNHEKERKKTVATESRRFTI